MAPVNNRFAKYIVEENGGGGSAPAAKPNRFAKYAQAATKPNAPFEAKRDNPRAIASMLRPDARPSGPNKLPAAPPGYKYVMTPGGHGFIPDGQSADPIPPRISGEQVQALEAEKAREAARAKARKESAGAFGGGMDMMPIEDDAGNIRPQTDWLPAYIERGAVGGVEALANMVPDNIQSTGVASAKMGMSGTELGGQPLGIPALSDFVKAGETGNWNAPQSPLVSDPKALQGAFNRTPRLDLSALKAPIPEDAFSPLGPLAEPVTQFMVARGLMGNKLGPVSGRVRDAAAAYGGFNAEAPRMSEMFNESVQKSGAPQFLKDFVGWMGERDPNNPMGEKLKQMIEWVGPDEAVRMLGKSLAAGDRLLLEKSALSPTNAGGARLGVTTPSPSPAAAGSAPTAAAPAPAVTVAPAATPSAPVAQAAVPQLAPAVAPSVAVQSNLPNGFFQSVAGDGYKHKAGYSPNVGVAIQSNTPSAQTTSYIRKDGGYGDARELNYVDESSLQDVWHPSNDAAKAEAVDLLNRMGGEADNARYKAMQDRLKKVVADDQAGTYAPAQPRAILPAPRSNRAPSGAGSGNGAPPPISPPAIVSPPGRPTPTPGTATGSLGEAEVWFNSLPMKTRESILRTLESSGVKSRAEQFEIIKDLNALPPGRNSQNAFLIAQKWGEKYPSLRENLANMGGGFAVTNPRAPDQKILGFGGKADEAQSIMDTQGRKQVVSERGFLERSVEANFGKPSPEVAAKLKADLTGLGNRYNALLDPTKKRRFGPAKAAQLEQADNNLRAYLKQPQVAEDMPEFVKNRIMASASEEMRNLEFTPEEIALITAGDGAVLAPLFSRTAPLKWSPKMWSHLVEQYPKVAGHFLQSAYGRAIGDATSSMSPEMKSLVPLLERARGFSSADGQGEGLLYLLEETMPNKNFSTSGAGSYQDTRLNYGDVKGAQEALKITERFKAAAQNGDSLAEIVDELAPLSPRQKEAALSQITSFVNDSMGSKVRNVSPDQVGMNVENAPNLTQLGNDNFLRALRKVFGERGDALANDIELARSSTTWNTDINRRINSRTEINAENVRNSPRIYEDPKGADGGIIDKSVQSLGAGSLGAAFVPNAQGAAFVFAGLAGAKAAWNAYKKGKRLTNTQRNQLADFFFRSREAGVDGEAMLNGAPMPPPSRGPSRLGYGANALVGAGAGGAAGYGASGGDPNAVIMGALGGAGLGAARARQRYSRNQRSLIKPAPQANALSTPPRPPVKAGFGGSKQPLPMDGGAARDAKGIEFKDGLGGARIGPAEATFIVDGDNIRIPMLRIGNTAERGKGAASRLLDAIIHKADAEGKRIFLTPEPVATGAGLTQRQLEKFYRSRGFVPNKGRSQDFEFRESFVRNPSKRSSSLPMDEASRMGRAREQGFDVDTPLYHGTTHDFDEFGGRPNFESHHGAGAYFSTSPDDIARNYATPKGQDLTNRIEHRAEQIQQELEDAVSDGIDRAVLRKYGVTENQVTARTNSGLPKIEALARDLARKELAGGHEGASIPAFARMKNPVVTNGGVNPSGLRSQQKAATPNAKSTRWDFETVWDDAGEEIVSEGGPALELVDATRSVLASTGMPDKYVDEIAAKLFDEVSNNEGITADAFERIMREDAGSIIDYESSPGQIIQDVYRAMGHDGIILKNAEREFPRMGMNPDTDHYVVFDPKNIRGKFAAFDPAEAGSSKLLAGMPAGTPEAALGVGGGAYGAANPVDWDGDGTITDEEKRQTIMSYGVGGMMSPSLARTAIRGVGAAKEAATLPKVSTAAGRWKADLKGNQWIVRDAQGNEVGRTSRSFDATPEEAIQAVQLRNSLRPSPGGIDQSTFGGVKAKTADLKLKGIAEQMEKAGASRDQIWKETGWFKGVDGKWRFEIDDSGARLRSNEEVAAIGDSMVQGAKDLEGRVKQSNAALREQPDLFPAALKRVHADMRKRAKGMREKANENFGPTWNEYNGRRLEYDLDHPAMIAAYPQLARDLVISRPGPSQFSPGLMGSYSDSRIKLNGPRNSDQTSTTLHETQHALQEMEDFATGGSPESAYMTDGLRREWAQEIDKILTPAPFEKFAANSVWDGVPEAEVRRQYKAMVDEMRAASKDIYHPLSKTVQHTAAYNIYKRLAGETEARNVQTRRDFTPEERRARPPWTTQDVPDDQQIVRYGAGKQESRPPKPPQAGLTFGGGKGPSQPQANALASPPKKPRPVEARREAPRGNKPFYRTFLSGSENKTAEMVFNGYDYSIIAEEMDTSIESVRVFAMRAQKKLAQNNDVQLPRPGMGVRPPGSTKREEAEALFDQGLDLQTVAERTGLSYNSAAVYKTAWKKARSKAPVASVNGASYNPPEMPPRPFEADYPPGDLFDGPPIDAQGRLGLDIDGRPLNQNAVIVGRRKAPGYGAGSEVDKGLRDKDATIQTLRNTGSDFERTPRDLMPSQTDGYWYPNYASNGRSTGRGVTAIADDLDQQVAGLDDRELMVIAHELAHNIDHKSNPARSLKDFDNRKWGIDPADSPGKAKVNDQLLRIYRDLNNAPGGQVSISRPLDRGYEQVDEARELWAEAIRAYMYDPNYIKTVAPDVAFLIRNNVNKNGSLRKTIQFNAVPTIVGVGGLGLGAAALSGQPAEAKTKAGGMRANALAPVQN